MQVLSVYTNAYASGGKAKVKSHATVLAKLKAMPQS